MTDQVEALKARRKAMVRKIAGTFKRSDDPHPKQRRATLTRQIDLLDHKIRQTRRQARWKQVAGPG